MKGSLGSGTESERKTEAGSGQRQLAIAAVAEHIVNLSQNTVDRIYIGHMPGVGADALTGVGLFFENKVFTVFLAEPVSDIVAAATTVTVFSLQFKKIPANGPQKR